MTFLTILGITEILYSFRSVLEGKTGKEILCHQDYCSYQTIFFRGGIAGLPLLKTLLGFPNGSEIQVSGKCWSLLFYYNMQVWQLQEI